jgi:Cu+-exporting ATPase
VAHAVDAGLTLQKVDALTGHAGAGIAGTVAGHEVAVGTRELMSRLGVDLAHGDTLLAPIERDAATAALVAVDGRVRAAVGFADALRDASREAVALLAQRGLRTVMLTGDNTATAQQVAAAAGIAEWHAGVGPEDKAARVGALTAAGRHVAMVGDGVNDAPALAVADLGIAMGEGTDVAMETAGITLMRPDPRLVWAALEVSRATRRTIRQNLFWAFVYNVVGIPVAAMGLLNPALAGAAMAMSSVCVVSNSLRLRRWRAPRPGSGR